LGDEIIREEVRRRRRYYLSRARTTRYFTWINEINPAQTSRILLTTKPLKRPSELAKAKERVDLRGKITVKRKRKRKIMNITCEADPLLYVD
jgi:hypothetical protein